MKKICVVTTISDSIRAFFIPQLKYLAGQGFDVTVICSPDDNLQGELGSEIKYIPVEIPRGISVVQSFTAVRKLLYIFKENKFDLIQYSTPNAGLYAAIAAKKAGCKLRNYHLMGLRYLGAKGIAKQILKLIEKSACKLSTSIECVSKSNLDLGIKEHLFKSDKATVVWNGSTGGVDLKRFNKDNRENYRKEIRKQYNIDENDFVYGFVGRITRDKGVNEILGAFSKIDNAKLMMVGAFENTDSLNQELYQDSKNSNRVIYTGNVNDIEKYFSAIDVLLLPSYREGFGNVVIEAAAMQTPSIVSNIPGPIDTVIAGKTGFLVEVKNEKSLLDAMTEIRQLDYKQMGIEAEIFVRESFDSDKLNEHILNRKISLLGE